MLKLNDGESDLWINPAHIVWFWDHGGSVKIKFVGQKEMFAVDGLTASTLARLLAEARDP